jgi:DNA-binding response OmpR family regulator
MGKTPIIRIAVVNENTVFLDLLDDLLTKEGYEVIVCKESSAAYEIVKKEKPDLVLLDIRREHQEGGWTVLELMKLDPVTRSIPVIVTSADTGALEEQQENLRQLGYTILPKPFDLESLLAKISETLSGSMPEQRPGIDDGDSETEG